MIYNQAGSASRTTLLILLGVGAFLAAAIMLLPKGFSNDVSKIGQGVASVVMVHDKNSMRSLDLMTLLGNVRSDYSDTVEFIVVDEISREGQIFQQQQNVGAINLIFFSANGVRQGTFNNSKSEVELRSALDKLSLGQL